MPAMSIEPLQLQRFQNALHARASLQGKLMQDGRKRSNLDRLVIRHGDQMGTRSLTPQHHVRAHLTVHYVSQPFQAPRQLRTTHITRQLHAAASSTRSSSRCSRIRPGFKAAFTKWQVTASRTIASNSSQESPCVAISPSGSRQFAVKPPSSAGRTRKTNSRSFMS